MKRIILGLIVIMLYTTNLFSYENQSAEKKYYAYCIVYNTRVDFGSSEDYWLGREPSLRNRPSDHIAAKMANFYIFVYMSEFYEYISSAIMNP